MSDDFDNEERYERCKDFGYKQCSELMKTDMDGREKLSSVLATLCILSLQEGLLPEYFKAILNFAAKEYENKYSELSKEKP
jgi:hypothetical protein